MPNFSIRDDDTSFFTSPQELERVYSKYLGKVPIALATVPFSVSEHRGRVFDSRYKSNDQVALGENKELVEWLKEKTRLGQIEIMLHGYNHQYKYINGRWVGEYGWKSAQQLSDETLQGKLYLEELLDVEIRIFVPPSNTISVAGIYAIRKAGLNLSGIMGRCGDRPLTLDYPYAYIKRWTWRIIRGEAFPFPISLGGIKELRAYALTPRADFNYLLNQLIICSKINAPFVVATHYWEFNEAPEMHNILARLINAAIISKYSFYSITKCFEPDLNEHCP